LYYFYFTAYIFRNTVLLEDCDEPIPNWPHKFPENLLINLYLMEQGSTFLLTTGQLLNSCA